MFGIGGVVLGISGEYGTGAVLFSSVGDCVYLKKIEKKHCVGVVVFPWLCAVFSDCLGLYWYFQLYRRKTRKNNAFASLCGTFVSMCMYWYFQIEWRSFVLVFSKLKVVGVWWYGRAVIQ